MKSILIVCAHADDQILGVGGTMAKYASLGYKIHTIICSRGEGSHPHLKPRVITKLREQETVDATEIVDGGSFEFYNLKEGAFLKSAVEQKTFKKLSKLIDRLKPEKVFTHSLDDVQIPGNDHRAVCKIVLKAWDLSKSRPAVYSFDVWNPWSFKSRYAPKLVVDISGFFGRKMKALRAFRSQKIQMQIPLLWLIIIRAFFHGFMSGTQQAEVFYRLK